LQLLVLVLNRVECLDDLIIKLCEAGIKGATVLDSRGMARILNDSEGLSILGSLRKVLDPDRQENKTIFIVLKDEQLDLARTVINKATGGIDKPDTGILFSLPVLFTEGMTV
jgi:hypothetical protein